MNAYVESFNGKLRDELLGVEIFTTLLEAKIKAEDYRQDYNQNRPYSSGSFLTGAASEVEAKMAQVIENLRNGIPYTHEEDVTQKKGPSSGCRQAPRVKRQPTPAADNARAL